MVTFYLRIFLYGLMLGTTAVSGKPARLRPNRGKTVPGRYMVKLLEDCDVVLTAKSMNHHFNPNPNSKAPEKSRPQGADRPTPSGWDEASSGSGKSNSRGDERRSENARVRFAFKSLFHGLSLERMTPKTLEWTLSNDCVDYVEAVGVMEATQYVGTEPPPITMVHGSYQNWGLDRITERESSAEHTYNPAGNGTGIYIYIVDTGVRRSHLEFGGRANYLNVFGDPAELGDDNGHGTQTAGIAIGTWRGTAREAKVISVKALDENAEGASDDILAALIAIKKSHTGGGAVVSMSLTTETDHQYIYDAIRELDESGFVIVAAAGNNGDNACFYYPAGYDEVISVGALNLKGAMASYSNFGPCVDIFAPGSKIYTATNEGDDQIKLLKGTSFAAPFVSGAAAILLEQGVPPEDVRDTIIADSTTSVTIKNLPADSFNRILYVEPVD